MFVPCTPATLSDWWFSVSPQGQRRRLEERQPELQQLLGEGRRLLQALGCPALENQLTLLGERWLSCSTRVAKELQRLEAILKHQSRSEEAFIQAQQQALGTQSTLHIVY